MRRKSAFSSLDMKSVGRRLSTLIAVQYDSVGEFADHIGISRNALYKIVHGEVTPEAQTLVDICRMLRCSVDFLLGVSTPAMEVSEGFDEALMNIYEFRSSWSREQKLYLVYAAMNLLTKAEEENLKIRLNVDC